MERIERGEGEEEISDEREINDGDDDADGCQELRISHALSRKPTTGSELSSAAAMRDEEDLRRSGGAGAGEAAFFFLSEDDDDGGDDDDDGGGEEELSTAATFPSPASARCCCCSSSSLALEESSSRAIVDKMLSFSRALSRAHAGEGEPPSRERKSKWGQTRRE